MNAKKIIIITVGISLLTGCQWLRSKTEVPVEMKTDTKIEEKAETKTDTKINNRGGATIGEPVILSTPKEQVSALSEAQVSGNEKDCDKLKAKDDKETCHLFYRTN